MVRSFRTFFTLALIALLGFNQASFAVAQTTTSINVGLTIPGTGGGGNNGGGSSDPLPTTDNAPSIGSVVATPGSTSAQITWTASDDKGISSVTLEYGTTESYGSSGTVSGSYVTNLTSLSASTHYFFRIRVTDSIGQVASYTDSFTTSVAADTTAPNVSGIVVTTNVTTATLRWVLSETGTSEVVYGLTSGYGQNSSSESGPSTNHITTLSGLVANTTYHYRISASDSSGNSTTTLDATFTTLADTVAPANPINGYGRIGRVAHRIIIEKHSDEIEVVAINAGSSTDMQGWMYLLKYDTTYGPLSHHALFIQKPEEVTIKTSTPTIGALVVDDKIIPFFSEKDPTKLPWKELDVDVVIESTGAFTTPEKIQPHLDSGAKSIVLSAPFKDEAASATYVLGVNLDPDKTDNLENVISNASCTTNCIAPVAAVMEHAFGIEKAMMTTIHSYTSDQRVQDGGHKDYRRARAAAQNIIPTSTGAAKAAAKAIPSLEGIFNGLAVRVPTVVGSLSDFTFLLKKNVTVEEVNSEFKNAADTPKWKGILRATTDPIVSSDIIGDSHSSIVDLSLTQVVGGNMVKVIAWYDNEFGYANRLVEETVVLGKKYQTK
jgi:glyceraldehyde 3-phosphate dehydrogenase